MSASSAVEPVHDIIGIGFGPSNLALAVAIDEHNRDHGEGISSLFLEKQPRFGWHRGMLIEGTTMQVSFLKDLATMRNPASDFTFLSYLHDRERLADFINHKTMFPTRVEYHDYLEWAASRLDHLVHYDSEVVEVKPVPDGDRVEYLDVVVRSGSDPGELVVHRTRDLVVATGLHASVPQGAALGRRVWHNLELLHRIGEVRDTDPRRLTVVGAGQSAAEVTEYLHRTFPAAEVCSVFGRYGHTPADDSPFANRIFDPQAVEDFYCSPAEIKRMLMEYHRNTNYSVVDLELIEELYARAYQEKVRGEQRLRMFNASRVAAVEPRTDGARVTVEFLPSGQHTVLDSDLLVYATGCRAGDPLQLLGDTGGYCLRDEDGELSITRDYRVRTGDDMRCGVYLQGGTEHTHGITSSLLSNGAVRAGEIRDSVLRRRCEPAGVRSDSEYALSGEHA